MAVIRCDGLVMVSVAGVRRYTDTSYTSRAHHNLNAAGRLPWKAPVRMLALVPGHAPVPITPRVRMSRHKYAVAGTVLPVSLDPSDPAGATILWDEVPRLDDWIAQGVEVFSNPDAARARIAAAHLARTGQTLSAVDSRATSTPGDSRACVLAVSPGDIRFEVLLSVATAGAPRFGYRWHGRVDKSRFISEWCDVPVRVDRKGNVEILWKQLSAKASQGHYPVDPARLRAALDAQLLALQQRHAAGLLTDEQYAEAQRHAIAQVENVNRAPGV